jgi:hypothetical protein
MKTVVHFFLLLALGLTLSSKLIAQSGTIYFTDGTTKVFKNILAISANAVNHPESSIGSEPGGLRVFYQNSFRTIPFSNMKTISLIPQYFNNRNFIVGELTVTTKNGIIINTPTFISNVVVSIYDELSNEIKPQDFRFGFNEKVLISKIEFD